MGHFDMSTLIFNLKKYTIFIEFYSLSFKCILNMYNYRKLPFFQLSSISQICDPMDCSMSGFPVHHQLPEFTQTHVYRISEAIQPSHPLSSPSPPAPNPSQHQSLFQ